MAIDNIPIEKSSGSPPTPMVARVVRTEEHLEKAKQLRDLRFTSMGHAALIEEHDAMDYDPHATVILVENRVTGLPLATIRVETGLAETFYPTDNFDIPSRYQRETSGYLTRLASVPGRAGRQASRLVLKAAYRYCMAVEVQWLIAFAVPPRDRRYLGLGFTAMPELPDLIPWPSFPDQRGVLMVCNLFEVERHWRESNHPNYPFFFRDRSPELEIFASLKPAWHSPRANNKPPHQPTKPPPDIYIPVI